MTKVKMSLYGTAPGSDRPYKEHSKLRVAIHPELHQMFAPSFKARVLLSRCGRTLHLIPDPAGLLTLGSPETSGFRLFYVNDHELTKLLGKDFSRMNVRHQIVNGELLVEIPAEADRLPVVRQHRVKPENNPDISGVDNDGKPTLEVLLKKAHQKAERDARITWLVQNGLAREKAVEFMDFFQ